MENYKSGPNVIILFVKRTLSRPAVFFFWEYFIKGESRPAGAFSAHKFVFWCRKVDFWAQALAKWSLVGNCVPPTPPGPPFSGRLGRTVHMRQSTRGTSGRRNIGITEILCIYYVYIMYILCI